MVGDLPGDKLVHWYEGERRLLRSIKLGRWQGHGVAFPERRRRYFNEPLCKSKRLRLTGYPSQRTLLPPVFTGTVRNNRRDREYVMRVSTAQGQNDE